MTADHTCDYCGRPVTPCGVCGSTEGHMIRADNHSDLWIHERQIDCIMVLQSDLSAARARVAELELLQAGAAEEPTP
jgi:hypothetical protein